MSKESKLDKKRTDYLENHNSIIKAYTDYIKENESPPTYKELSEITGLHENSIYNHMKKIKKRNLNEIIKKFRIVTEAVIFKLVQDILSGEARTSKYKLFFQLVEKWSEKTEIDMNFDRVVESIDITVHKNND
ncbi:MAG: hypothetical protein K9N00_04155 [Candidatus Marinimicrobia bacterium]|nr:hypothetical protein [Candidatus Neomarinimicrobiota bacterium]